MPPKTIPGRPGPTAAENDLAQRALKALKRLAIDAGIEPARNRRAGWQPDFTAKIGRGRNRQTYLVEVKRELRPAALGPLILRLREAAEPVMLIAEHVTPAMAETLRAANVAFLDPAGNAWINQPGHMIYVTGRKPERRAMPERPVRAFHAAGLRVIFAFLCEPELVALPTRELAARTGLANGTIGWVLQDLRKEGFLLVAGKRKRRLTRLRALLDRWAEAYPGQLRAQIVKGRFRAEEAPGWEMGELKADTVLLGGEPAADRLTHYLKPAVVTLYVRGDARTRNLIIVRHRLLNDPGGNVEILDAFWPIELPVAQIHLVPTPLIYADLLATRNARCIETAGIVYEQYLADTYKKY